MLLTLGGQLELTAKGTVQMMGAPVLFMSLPFSGKQLFEDKVISSRIQIFIRALVRWHKTLGWCLQRAAGDENETVRSLWWLRKCAQHVLSAGQKLPLYPPGI